MRFPFQPFQTLISVGSLAILGSLLSWPSGPSVAQTPSPDTPTTPAAAPTPAKPDTAKSLTFYDRYMQTGYDATKQRQFATALLYFKRALDERPDDAYALQAIRNVESYLNTATPTPPSVAVPPVTTTPAPASPKPISASQPKPKPTQPATATTKPATAKPTSKPTTTQPAPKQPTATKPTATKPTPAATVPPSQLAPPKTPPTSKVVSATGPAPTAVVTIPAAPASDAFSEQQAIALINRWLQAKIDVFAPPFDMQQVADLTTGELLAALVRPDGVLNWLKTNRAYFRYGVQKVDSVERFVVARDRATMEINLTEDRTLYLNGVIDPSRTDFSSQIVRFTFGLENGVWKISDYKTVNGSLLERSILNATSSNVR